MGEASRRMYETEFGVSRMLSELDMVYANALRKKQLIASAS